MLKEWLILGIDIKKKMEEQWQDISCVNVVQNRSLFNPHSEKIVN